MSIKIRTLEDYYTKFPYPQEIIERQELERQQNKQYVEKMTAINPWLAENIYNEKTDQLPSGWISLYSDTEKKPFYKHMPTEYITWYKPSSTTPEPYELFGGVIYAYSGSKNKMIYYYKKTNTEYEISDDWELSVDNKGVPIMKDRWPLFTHKITGLKIYDFVPYTQRDLKINIINDNFIQYSSPIDGKIWYYNKVTNKYETIPPDA